MKIMKTKYPMISIVISNYNGVKLGILKDCLKSFINKMDYPNYELILVDNDSKDNSIKVSQRIFGKNPRCKIVQNPVNAYSQGLNLGLAAAKGEYVAYFGNDTALEKNHFTNLIKAFARYPKLALAQGKVLMYYDHSIIDSVGESIDIFGNPVTTGYKAKDEGQYESDEEILSATGTACILKKSALKKVGNFDPSYGIGYEDIDLALRIRLQGFQVMRIPSAICYHKKGGTDLSPMVRVRVKWTFNKNRISTMIKNYPLPLLFRTLPVTVFIYLGIMIWDLVINRDFKLAMTRPLALIWLVFHTPSLLKARADIRSQASNATDEKMLKFFAPADIFGKIKAVFMDKFINKNSSHIR
mgnify:CR=1 FL=1